MFVLHHQCRKSSPTSARIVSQDSKKSGYHSLRTSNIDHRLPTRLLKKESEGGSLSQMLRRSSFAQYEKYCCLYLFRARFRCVWSVQWSSASSQVCSEMKGKSRKVRNLWTRRKSLLSCSSDQLFTLRNDIASYRAPSITDK